MLIIIKVQSSIGRWFTEGDNLSVKRNIFEIDVFRFQDQRTKCVWNESFVARPLGRKR